MKWGKLAARDGSRRNCGSNGAERDYAMMARQRGRQQQ